MRRATTHLDHAWSMLEKIIARVRHVDRSSRNTMAKIRPENRGALEFFGGMPKLTEFTCSGAMVMA